MELIEQSVSALAEKLGTTAEVITKFLSDASAEEVKPFAASLPAMQVYKPDELATRIQNEREAAALEAKNTTIGSTYGAMDKRILEDTGIAKNEGEKTIEYMARAAKEKYGSKKEESEEMTQLRSDLTAAKDLLRTKDSELQTATTKLQGMEVEFATRLQGQHTNAAIDAAINAIKIDASDAYLPSQRKLLKMEFNERFEAKIVDGKTIFVEKATGKEKRDDRLADPMTAEAIIQEFAPQVVSVKQSQKRGTEVRDTSKKNSTDTNDFAAYDSLDAYKKVLAEQGIVLSSSTGQDAIAKYIAYRDSKK